ncbi:LytR/AlgR family response regulator transcription factor [Synoicihabitans lomoniglobus]|uniref:LytTR family DNA-binding domain-containing protein n=1 Tax=Synoicihabitans lomoniglobus TaxID=2909285 RepID=A0AAF0CLN0_9BACT|nr:LytTR family DNA-binding domain-containing protein [Opitutaceae bacterium LMO-M01]WED63078.1 LytTR family DNA-binding domain-containing protein [Opitutaceae bacterium LMO-M01]
MKSMRTLIVDDEPLARERLRRLCDAESMVEIVGECGSGAEALSQLHAGGVDLLFLDVEMPGATGLEVLAELPAADRPAVIFATAHDQFALEAFDQEAVDYLLKPFDRERFQQALRRAETFLQARHGAETEEKLEALLAKVAQQEIRPDRLTFKVDGKVVFLRPAEIAWVEAADNYVVLHLESGPRHMVRDTMTAVERRLGVKQFVRVNRSALVQLDQIKELQPGAHGDYTILLRDGARLPLSRSLRGKLNTLFGPTSD